MLNNNRWADGWYRFGDNVAYTHGGYIIKNIRCLSMSDADELLKILNEYEQKVLTLEKNFAGNFENDLRTKET